MRHFATALAAAALLMTTTPLAAQTWGFGAHAGVSIPIGDYGDTEDATFLPAKLGYSAGLDLVYPLLMVSPALGWYTSADVIAHSVDDDFEEASDGGYLYFPLMTGLRLGAPIGPVNAFATGQLGVILTKGPTLDGGVFGEADGDLGTRFGFSLGAGLMLGQNLYAGLKYYPLGDVEFQYEGAEDGFEQNTSFLDIYVGFGVF